MQNVNNYIHNWYMTVICTSQAVFWLLGALAGGRSGAEMQHITAWHRDLSLYPSGTTHVIFWLLGAQHLYQKRNYTLQRGPLKLIDFNPSIDK